MDKKTKIGPFLLIVASFAKPGWSAPLSLADYLKQVTQGHEGLKASQALSQAAPEKAADATMIYAPTVFATLQSAVDKKQMMPAAQRGNETDYLSAQFGISKLTPWGTAGKLYYSASQTKIHGTSKLYVPEPDWRETAPTLEVTHPLWKNAHGKDVEKTVELESTKATITQLSETMKRKASMAEAEGNYWRLVLARESVRVARENLERAGKIVEWNRRRVKNELADSADLIQAEALGEVREIELRMAVDEERSAAHAFNTSRGDSSGEVKDELLKITPELIESLPTPAKSGDREDLQATIAAEKISGLGADLSSDKYDPSLDIFASGTLNGRDTNSYSKANATALKAKHSTYAIGLKFSAPIGGEALSRVRSGYTKDKEAAAMAANRKRFENDREWSDLGKKLEESKSRLNLTQRIEKTQQRKLSAERERQSRGRSTMFQVMQCETDYAAAQLNVIRNKAEILGIIARMKTFGGEG
jgi:outer membrane protein TolC